MQDIEFAQPKVTIYSDYTAKPYEGDYKELVRAQVENPVRWQTIVEMCIRDRIVDYVKSATKPQLEKLVGIFNLQYNNGDADTRAIITIVSVSYTHLDVYKRQVQ